AAFAHLTDVPAAGALRAVAGHGVEGTVDGRRWRIGTAPFAIGAADDGAVWLGADRACGASPAPTGEAGARARFAFAERERPDAARAVARLREQGLALHLASGDAAAPVARFAEAVGIDDAHA